MKEKTQSSNLKKKTAPKNNGDYACVERVKSVKTGNAIQKIAITLGQSYGRILQFVLTPKTI